MKVTDDVAPMTSRVDKLTKRPAQDLHIRLHACWVW